MEVCSECGGKVKIIVSIKEPLLSVPALTALVHNRQGWRKCSFCMEKKLSLHVIDQILSHLDLIDDVIPLIFQLP